MLESNYETYAKKEGELPFIFSGNIVRTPEACSAAANWHEDIELHLYLEGEGIVLIDGEKHEVSAGSVMIVGSEAIHYTKPLSHVRYACLIIDTRFARSSGLDLTDFVLEPIPKNDVLKGLIEKMAGLVTNHEDPCREAKLRLTTLEILIEIRENQVIGERAVGSMASLERIKKCIHYIRCNYTRKIALDDIAKYVLTDKYSLSREFKRATRQTFTEYINAYRCKKVAELLSEGESVARAAMLCGFNNMSFFTKVFKRHMGVLPSKYGKE